MNMFREVLDVAKEEVAKGDKDRVMGFVMVGEQANALFDFRQLFFKIIDMGTLDIVHDDPDRERLEIACAEDLLFECPEERGYKIPLGIRQGWMG